MAGGFIIHYLQVCVILTFCWSYTFTTLLLRTLQKAKYSNFAQHPQDLPLSGRSWGCCAKLIEHFADALTVVDTPDGLAEEGGDGDHLNFLRECDRLVFNGIGDDEAFEWAVVDALDGA